LTVDVSALYRQLGGDDRVCVKERALQIREAAKRTAEEIVRLGSGLPK
jgi:hypothetical protein